MSISCVDIDGESEIENCQPKHNAVESKSALTLEVFVAQSFPPVVQPCLISNVESLTPRITPAKARTLLLGEAESEKTDGSTFCKTSNQIHALESAIITVMKRCQWL